MYSFLYKWCGIIIVLNPSILAHKNVYAECHVNGVELWATSYIYNLLWISKKNAHTFRNGTNSVRQSCGLQPPFVCKSIYLSGLDSTSKNICSDTSPDNTHIINKYNNILFCEQDSPHSKKNNNNMYTLFSSSSSLQIVKRDSNRKFPVRHFQLDYY